MRLNHYQRLYALLFLLLGTTISSVSAAGALRAQSMQETHHQDEHRDLDVLMDPGDREKGSGDQGGAGSRARKRGNGVLTGGGAHVEADPTSPPTPTPPTLTYAGNNQGNQTLYKCQGDCDRDEECIGDLKCFLRGELGRPRDAQVPGCLMGRVRNGVDFCYDPNDEFVFSPAPTTAAPVTSAPVTPAPTNPAPVTPAPVTPAPVAPFGFGGVVPLPTGAPITPDPTPAPAEPTPAPIQPTPSIPENSFILKLFWKYPWAWQGIQEDLMYCLECESVKSSKPQACKEGDLVLIHPCSESHNTRFKFDEVDGTNGEQVRIRAKGDDKLCWRLEEDIDAPPGERGHGAIWIRMRDCDKNDERQRWETKGNGAFWEDRFEIYPTIEGDSCADGERQACEDRCVTMMHHPRPGEDVWAEDCRLARRDATSWWMRYDE